MKTEQQTSKTLTIGKIAQRYESSKTNAKDNSQNNDDFKAKASRAALIGAAPPNYLLPDCPNDETLLDLKLGYSLLSHHSLYCVGLADDLRRRADRDHRFINLHLSASSSPKKSSVTMKSGLLFGSTMILLDRLLVNGASRNGKSFDLSLLNGS